MLKDSDIGKRAVLYGQFIYDGIVESIAIDEYVLTDCYIVYDTGKPPYGGPWQDYDVAPHGPRVTVHRHALESEGSYDGKSRCPPKGR